MKKDASTLLREAKLKVTPARVAILKAFSAKCHPLCAEGISFKLKKNKIDSVTVYRTLTTFEEAGIVRRVDLRRDSIYFELTIHHHHHLVCTDCGTIEKISKCDIGLIAEKVIKQSKKFSKIRSHSFEIFGICRPCLKK